MLKIVEELELLFPGLYAPTVILEGVTVETGKTELQEFKRNIVNEIRQKYYIDNVKDAPLMRAYRDFYWRIGIDPTKDRPAAEALVRRILAEKPIPTINTLVDAYNLASIKSFVPMAAFDAEKTKGELLMRLAKAGEEFSGIGMRVPQVLKGNEPVVSDQEKLVAIYPYRDADSTKITLGTKNVLLMICGAPRVELGTLDEALKVAVEYITRFCGGMVKT
jgi:DNA/RNA-binding domain of Phe-tRNA-synthetase-like protein